MNNNYYLTGSETAVNLAKAFAGESQARNRYTFYADAAGKEGYPTIKRIFLDTADNERGHAEALFEFLTEGLERTVLTPQAEVPAAFGKTMQNLRYAAEGEREEWSRIYPEFGRKAEQEGFHEIAESFYSFATVEKRHDVRFMQLYDRMRYDMLFVLPAETTWICINCGLHIKGKGAPDRCPACRHPKVYFMTEFDEGYPYDNDN